MKTLGQSVTVFSPLEYTVCGRAYGNGIRYSLRYSIQYSLWFRYTVSKFFGRLYRIGFFGANFGTINAKNANVPRFGPFSSLLNCELAN